MTTAQGPCGMRIPRAKSAAISATDWPTTASQRKRISVRSRTQPLRASVGRSGRLGSVMARGIAAATIPLKGI